MPVSSKEFLNVTDTHREKIVSNNSSQECLITGNFELSEYLNFETNVLENGILKILI